MNRVLEPFHERLQVLESLRESLDILVPPPREPSGAGDHKGWARKVIAAGADASTGRAYVNFLGDADAVSEAYGDQKYARLVALKTQYDPTNLFRLNHNIEPRPMSA